MSEKPTGLGPTFDGLRGAVQYMRDVAHPEDRCSPGHLEEEDAVRALQAIAIIEASGERCPRIMNIGDEVAFVWELDGKRTHKTAYSVVLDGLSQT